MPSAPGNRPKRLSNEWFSIMISTTCLMGDPGATAWLAVADDVAARPPASTDTRDTLQAVRILEGFTSQLCGGAGRV